MAASCILLVAYKNMQRTIEPGVQHSSTPSDIHGPQKEQESSPNVQDHFHSIRNYLMRKFFHLVVVIVFVTGLYLDPEFLFSSSVVAIGILVIFEVGWSCDWVIFRLRIIVLFLDLFRHRIIVFFLRCYNRELGSFLR